MWLNAAAAGALAPKLGTAADADVALPGAPPPNPVPNMAPVAADAAVLGVALADVDAATLGAPLANADAAVPNVTPATVGAAWLAAGASPAEFGIGA